MGFFTGKKILALGFIVVLLAAIPFAVYLLQKQQEMRSRAAKSTTLSLVPTGSLIPATINKKVGEKFNLDVIIDPGTNVVTNLTLHVIYDEEKIATDTAEGGCGSSFCQTAVFLPNNNIKYTPGSIRIDLSTNPGPGSYVQTKTKVGSLTFKALAPTSVSPTQIGFGDKTLVTAQLPLDPEENVLSTTNPAIVNITNTVELTPSPTTSTTPVLTSTTNQSPVCDSLNVDRITTGVAPFSITFTANGRDSDGTISKITFDFGDGPVQDITQANGIGSNSVSAQIAHTYQNPGTYKASVVLTDSNSATSNPTTCTQTITVSQASGGSSGGQASATGGTSGTSSAEQTIIETPAPTLIVQAPLTPPGPGDRIITIGIAGAVLSILGALLFFAL